MPITSSQLAIQKTLQEALADAQVKNRAFSLRAFARRLGVSPSSLSEILNGKRRVSKRLATRLTERLCLAPAERDALLSLFPEKTGTGGAEEVGKDYTLLSADRFHAISDWYHFAILSLAETKDFRAEADWIAQRLNIRVGEAQSALDRLLRLGLLAQNAKGKIVPTGAHFSTTDDIQNLALRRAHLKNLDLAHVALEEDPVELRDFTAVTMAIDPSRLPIAKRMVREFQDRLSAVLETGERTEVYKICVQLFPLTKEKGRVA